jgi:hypothetical protein
MLDAGYKQQGAVLTECEREAGTVDQYYCGTGLGQDMNTSNVRVKYQIVARRRTCHFISLFRLNVVVEWITLVPCTREFPASNLDPETGYPDRGFSWLSSVPPDECRSSTLKITTTVYF